MGKTVSELKGKIKDLEREVRRGSAMCATLRKENVAVLQRAQAAEHAVEATAMAYNALIVRVALALGEDVIDETRGKVIGKRLTLPPQSNDELRELIHKWQVKTRVDEKTGANIYAVGLRDDPDDHKSEAELDEERKAYREGGQDDE